MAIRQKQKDGSTVILGGDMTGVPGPKGTRWGTTSVWMFGTSFPNSDVAFPDGLPPRIGDYVVSTHAWGPGAVGIVSGLIDNTHADLVVAGYSLQGPVGPQGPQGPAGTALDAYPVGAIYLSIDITNPGTIFGGTWAVFSAGRVLIGVDTGQVEFNAVEKTSGAKTHTHGLTAAGAAVYIGSAVYTKLRTVLGWTADRQFTATGGTGGASSTAIGASGNVALYGDTDAGSTLQPGITCYMWKRTA